VITSNKKTIINLILKDEIEKEKNSIKKRPKKVQANVANSQKLVILIMR
jgi:hypothetical protein